jgi:hypothetical protein
MPRALVLAIGLVMLVPGAPGAQGPAPFRWEAPDPIGHALERARRPLPALPPAPVPAEVVVPERRVTLPGGEVVVVPSHRERRISDQAFVVPPLPAFRAGGGGPVHLPGGVRPPAELRPGP